jgi:hypothetical protein
MFFLDTYIYIKKVTLKEIKTMKNILAENLLRFGVKNLNETDVKILSESLLLEQIALVDNALKALNAATAAKPIAVQGSRLGWYPVVSIGYVPANPGQPGYIKGGIEPAEIRGAADEKSYVIAKTNKNTSVPSILRSTWGCSSNDYSKEGDKIVKNAMVARIGGYESSSVGLFAVGLHAPQNAKQAGRLTKQEFKDTILGLYKKFYNTTGLFDGLKGAYTSGPTDPNIFNTQIDTLITALDTIKVDLLNTATNKTLQVKIFQG